MFCGVSSGSTLLMPVSEYTVNMVPFMGGNYDIDFCFPSEKGSTLKGKNLE